MKLLKQKYLMGAAAIALAVPGIATSVRADPALDAVLERLDRLEKENAKLKGEIKKIENKSTAAKPVAVKAAPTPDTANGSGFIQVAMPKDAYGAPPPLSYKDEGYDDWFFRHKPGSGLTFLTPNGQITFYGQLDVSLDYATKGIANKVVPANEIAGGGPGGVPVGRMGWLADLSTNISYFGLRGEQNLGGSFKDLSSLKFVYQLET